MVGQHGGLRWRAFPIFFSFFFRLILTVRLEKELKIRSMIPEMLALHSLLREISTGIFKKKIYFSPYFFILRFLIRKFIRKLSDFQKECPYLLKAFGFSIFPSSPVGRERVTGQ